MAGFAADAHARLEGLGVAVVTYGVGALKLLNPVAGADAERSPLVLVGDGALLMSAIELATLARYRIPALVVGMDNAGYGTERPMLDGPFNDVAPVDHVGLALAMGFHAARRVALDPQDASDALRNLTTALGEKVKAASLER